MNDRAPTLMIMAGGTGGHVYPALAVAHLLMERGIAIVWVGNAGKIEQRVAEQAGIPFEAISVKGVRGNGVLRWLAMPFSVLRSMLEISRVVSRYRPSAMLGMGGFVTGPGGIVAWLRRIPLLLHEANTIAGMTNRWLYRFSTVFMTGFERCDGINGSFEVTGNPVRDEICQVAQQHVDNSGEKPLRLFVFGGSLGAQILNELTPCALDKLAESERPSVLHQTGRHKLEATVELYRDKNVAADLREFIDDMAGAYREADLVISRAGAMSVAEIACAGVASLLVPYPYAVNDHQLHNAEFLAEKGAAELVTQDQLNTDTLAEKLKSLLGNREKLAHMGQAARELARPHATRAVADRCMEALHA